MNDERWHYERAKPLCWGYFFTSEVLEDLAPLSVLLQPEGYSFVELDEDSCCLRVERIEIHDPASLHKRDAQLAALAGQFGVISYGTNVGLP